MTATALTPAVINRLAGGLDMSTVTLVATDATNGNSMQNSGNLFIDAHNTDSTPRALTFAIVGGTDGIAAAPLVVTIAAAATRRIGPFPAGIYGGTLNFTSASALVTVAGFTLPTT